MTLAALPALVRASLSWLLPRQLTHALARLAPRLTCCAIAALSLSRATALVRNYGAPMRLYRHLPQARLLQHDPTSCVLSLSTQGISRPLPHAPPIPHAYPL